MLSCPQISVLLIKDDSHKNPKRTCMNKSQRKGTEGTISDTKQQIEFMVHSNTALFLCWSKNSHSSDSTLFNFSISLTNIFIRRTTSITSSFLKGVGGGLGVKILFDLVATYFKILGYREVSAFYRIEKDAPVAKF